MSNLSVKIPAQHYCGMKKRDNNDVPLGFITPYGTDSAAQKRIKTVDHWVATFAKNTTIPSKIIDNIPLSGFKLSNTIKRTSTWGKGNVLWRIEDPRGFEIEITNNNLMQIMSRTTIINGEIICSCVWGREGSDNVLIPTDSTLYKEATANTVRLTKKVSTKSLTPWSNIVLQNGIEGTYLGSFFEILYYDNDKITKITVSPNKKHFIFVKKGQPTTTRITKKSDLIMCMATINVAEVLSSSNREDDPQEFINNAISDPTIEIVSGQFDYLRNTIGVSTSTNITGKIKITKLKEDIIKYSDQFPSFFSSKKLIGDFENSDTLIYTATYAINNIKKIATSQVFDIIKKEPLFNQNIIERIQFISDVKYRYRSDSILVNKTVSGNEYLSKIKTWYTMSYIFTDKTGKEIELTL